MTIQEAIKQAISELGLPARKINERDCFNFASIVFNLIPGSKIGGHNIDGEGQSYIEYDGRCYDSECPQGTDHWTKLPTFKGMLK
jgi:hypothetical protein